MIKPHLKNFVNWCKKEPGKKFAAEIITGNPNACNEFTKQHAIPYKGNQEFLNNAIEKVNFIKIVINGSTDIYSKVIKSDSIGFEHYIHELSLAATLIPALSLKNLNINKLIIESRHDINLNVDDCNIRDLRCVMRGDTSVMSII